MYLFLILYIWVFCLQLCMCTTGMPGALGGQKKALGPEELELWRVVNYHMGSGNGILFFWKSIQCSPTESPPQPLIMFLESVSERRSRKGMGVARWKKRLKKLVSNWGRQHATHMTTTHTALISDQALPQKGASWGIEVITGTIIQMDCVQEHRCHFDSPY